MKYLKTAVYIAKAKYARSLVILRCDHWRTVETQNCNYSYYHWLHPGLQVLKKRDIV